MGNGPASLTERLLRGEKVELKVFGLARRTHGEAVGKYDPLILRFGSEASPNVAKLTKNMAAGRLSGSTAVLEAAEEARAELLKLANKLPANERARVGLALVRDGQTIIDYQLNLAKDFAEGVEENMAKMAEERAAKVLSLEALEAARAIPKTGDVLAHLGMDFKKFNDELQELWQRYWKVVPLGSPFMEFAAASAAAHAPAIANLLRKRGAKATQAIWGHLVNPRGAMGEGYGLLNRVWLPERDLLLGGARKTALGLGPGNSVQYMTQLENGILLNGKPGPDAIVGIFDLKNNRIRVPARAQVKVATSSEGAKQSVLDEYRSAGLEKTGPVGLAYYSVKLSKGGELRTFQLVSDIDERFYVINAAGGSMPRGDLELLSKLMAIEERGLDMSVKQLTHLSISLVEAAMKAAKAAAK